MTHEERDLLWTQQQQEPELELTHISVGPGGIEPGFRVYPAQDSKHSTRGEARLARFDATQDVLLAAGAMNRSPPALPLTPSEFDAKAEELAAACRRYLAAHEAVKAGGR